MRVFRSLSILAQLALPVAALSAQAATKLTQQVRQQYVSVSEPVIALTNVTIIDGPELHRSLTRPSSSRTAGSRTSALRRAFGHQPAPARWTSPAAR
jgi:hypothetical protein